MDEVVLVDEKDREIGVEEKMAAHRRSALHRAISVFVFNARGETMMQQRADAKYHSAGLWSNTACSHPFKGESALDAGHRRLREEMGFDCALEEAFTFTYEAGVGNGLTEHEFDHVLFGVYDGKPELNRDEAKSWKWVSMRALQEAARRNPDSYTPWLLILLKGDLPRKAGEFAKRISTSPGTS